jgi:hypothetical protein
MNVETEAETQRLRSEQRRNAGSISSSTVDEAARLGERIGGQPAYLSLGNCTKRKAPQLIFVSFHCRCIGPSA